MDPAKRVYIEEFGRTISQLSVKQHTVLWSYLRTEGINIWDTNREEADNLLEIARCLNNDVFKNTPVNPGKLEEKNQQV